MHKVEEIPFQLQGWSSSLKLMKLYSLVVTHKMQRTVELGAFGGRGCSALAWAHQEVGGVCLGVDPYSKEVALEFEEEEANLKWWGNVDYEKLYRDLLIYSLANGLTKTLQILRMTSEEAAKIFSRDTIDLLVVDANHNFLAVSKDFELWLPKVKEGGYLLADDLLWDGVSKAKHLIYEYGFKELEIVDDPAGSQWGLFQKMSNSED